MVIPIKITLIEDPPFEGSLRALNEIKRSAYLAMGRYWFAEMLPKHFTRSAREVYGYQERGKTYQKRKERRGQSGRGQVKYGGMVDNVYTGASERDIRGSAVIRAFPSRFSITMPSPKYFAMRPYKSGQPNKGEEIAKVTNEEIRTLAEVGTKELEAGLNAYREHKETKAE